MLKGNQQSRPRCFLLLPRPVFPVVSGYSLKNRSLIRILAEHYQLRLGVICEKGLSDEERAFYRALDVRYFTFRIPKWKSMVRTAAGLFSDRPLQLAYYYDPVLLKRVRKEAARADVVIGALIRTRQYFDAAGAAISGAAGGVRGAGFGSVRGAGFEGVRGAGFGGVRGADAGRDAGTGVGRGSAARPDGPVVVFDMVDSIAMNYARSEKKTRSPYWKLIYRIEEKRLAAYEQKFVRESDVTFLFNPGEQKAMAKHGHVVCLPHGVDEKLFSYGPEAAGSAEMGAGAGPEAAVGADQNLAAGTAEGSGAGQNLAGGAGAGAGVSSKLAADAVEGSGLDQNLAAGAVVFMGKMDYQPNVDAALWYLKKVHPHLTGKVPFVIVGAYPVKAVCQAAEQFADVTVTGFVDDPYRIAAGSLCMVAPMQSGGGIQNKVLEGMALGKVNLVSSLAAAALTGVESGRELWVADQPEDYVKRILALQENPESGRAMGERAREYIKGRYTWEKYGEAYLKEIL